MSTNLEARQQQIKLRQLEIQATLTEWRRAFYAEGKERPFADRCALEAEAAALALEHRRNSQAAVEAAVKRRAALNASAFEELKRLLAAEGRADLIGLAEERSAAALAALEAEGVQA